jgi:hypothetical protein
MFWYGLLIGACIGVLAMGFMRMSSHDKDCRSCKAYFMTRERALETAIHGLKSSKGKLQEELNAMAFRNSGYNAR